MGGIKVGGRGACLTDIKFKFREISPKKKAIMGLRKKSD